MMFYFFSHQAIFSPVSSSFISPFPPFLSISASPSQEQVMGTVLSPANANKERKTISCDSETAFSLSLSLSVLCDAIEKGGKKPRASKWLIVTLFPQVRSCLCVRAKERGKQAPSSRSFMGPHALQAKKNGVLRAPQPTGNWTYATTESVARERVSTLNGE